MMKVYEASIRGHKVSPAKMVTTLTIEAALSHELAQELGCNELYRKGGELIEFTGHGFDHNIDAARVTFFPMPGTPGEDSALMCLRSCTVNGFYATRLDGAGAKVEFHVVTDVDAVLIVEFERDIRGWNGRLDIEPLQQELLEAGNGQSAERLPAPPKKRGRGGVPQKASEEEVSSEVVHALHSGEADVKVNKKGSARLVPRKPKSGEKKPRRK
jgi:hypothetical protein